MPGDRSRDKMLIEAGLALASELDLDSVLQRIVEIAAELADARYCALSVLDASGTRIERFITHGVSDEERAAIGDLPVGHGILGLLIEERRAIRLADISSDPRSYGFPPNHPAMHSLLGAPVVALGKVFGNIYLTEKQGADLFTQDDEEALIALASHAGVAIDNARLYEAATRAEQELRRMEMVEERERIAKELHDGVIQSLFAVGMSLQGAAAMASDIEVSRRVEAAVEEIDRAIRDLRNYIFGLRPGILADRQLDQAIQELASEFGARGGVLTVVDVDAEVASELASRAPDIVQVIREALSNVGKHAEATTCRITLRRGRDGDAELEIDDDGRGFVSSAGGSGMGLANLHDRVTQMGGALSIDSIEGEGTTLRASFPL
jgi:two-component system, NarL family, sensor histidine kinase DevS